MLNDQGKLNCPELRIENTNICNGNCIICPREKLTRPLGIMSYGMFKDIVDQAIVLGITDVSIFGFGEPLMDSGVSDKVSYAANRGLKTHITTNGSLLSWEMANDLLDAGLENLRFSIHATNPINYRRVHRNLDWLAVWGNFAEFVRINKKLGSPCSVHLSVIPMHDETVEEIRATWEKYVQFLEIWRPHNWNQGRGYRPLLPQRRTCGRPFGGPLQVQVDGTVIPCCFLTNSELVLGNVKDDTLYNILTGGPYEALREAHRTGSLSEYPCEHCDQLNAVSEGVLLYSSRDSERKLNRLSTSKKNVSGTDCTT
jgi:radical SAM protein with 4Fe4S-binding SPASM domain